MFRPEDEAEADEGDEDSEDENSVPTDRRVLSTSKPFVDNFKSSVINSNRKTANSDINSSNNSNNSSQMTQIMNNFNINKWDF